MAVQRAHHSVGARQVEALPACPRGQQEGEHRVLLRVEPAPPHSAAHQKMWRLGVAGNGPR